jgi:hypothetical protein
MGHRGPHKLQVEVQVVGGLHCSASHEMAIQNLEWQWMVALRLLQQHWRCTACMQVRSLNVGLGDLSGEPHRRVYGSILHTDAAEGSVRQQPSKAEYKPSRESQNFPLAADVVNRVRITAVYVAATFWYSLAASSSRSMGNVDERASGMGFHAVAATFAVQMRPD